MPVTQRLMKPGAFHLELVENYPRSIAAAIDQYDHIVVTPNRLQPIDGYTDANILSNAIFTGVITRKASPRIFEGSDLAYWLGTPSGTGDILTAVTGAVAGSTLSTWWTTMKPAALNTGTITNAGTTVRVIWPFQWITRREAWDSVCQSMGAEWRVNPNFTMDAAVPGTLFVTTPTVVVTRLEEGPDGQYRGLDGGIIVTAADVDEYTTAVVCVAAGNGATVSTATATSGATVYKDGLNNNVIMTRLVNAPTQTPANASTVATQVLNQFSTARQATTLSSRTYCITRFVDPGDTVYVWDQLAGLVDASNQITYRGELITPIALRVYALTWPLEQGMGVYARRSGATPTYTDLTDYILWEAGQDVQWEIGSVSQAVSNGTALSGSAAYLGANPAVSGRTAPQGALTTYVPVVNQGATPTLSSTWSSYSRVGREITGSAQVQITSAGTAANAVSISMPNNMANTNVGAIVGTGIIFDASAGFYYYADLVPVSANTVQFQVRANGAAATYLGSSTFTAALANLDIVSVWFHYETDADS